MEHGYATAHAATSNNAASALVLTLGGKQRGLIFCF